MTLLSCLLQMVQEEVAKDVEVYGVALRDEATLMLSVAEALERYERDNSAAGVSKWKLPTSGRPISLFGVPSTEDSVEPHRVMRAQDDSKGSGMSPEVSLSPPLMCSSGNVCSACYLSPSSLKALGVEGKY